jgi:hypothetical protein
MSAQKIIRTRNSMVGRSKIFGHTAEKKLDMEAHVKGIKNKAIQRFVAFYFIFRCRILNTKLKTHLYKSLIRPILLYGAPAWGYGATSNMKMLQVIQK